MFITFTRGEKKGTYATTALRDDGVLLQVPGSDRTFSFPHDLAHYVVEQGLGLQRGFWGRVARGAIYPGMTVLSGRQPPHAAQRSRMVIREDEQQGVQAEVLVGVLLHIMHAAIENDEAAVRTMLDNEWRPRKPERGLPDRDEVQRACAALRQAEHDWRRLEVGQSLTVTWQPAIPMKRRKSKGS